jgi:predicted nucleic acid-binding Zn ribbon protein
MRRNKAESIGKLVQKFLREEGLESPLNEQRLMMAWPDIVGNGIARYTGEMYIRNQVLYINIKSPALKADLMMAREQLTRRLNESVGSQVITNIMFR